MIDQGDSNVYENGLKFAYGMNQMDTGVIPMYVPSVLIDTVSPAGVPISRKRSRDLCSFDPSVSSNGSFTFLGEDVSMQIYQHQLEIDRFIDQHTEKMRSEIEASRRIITMRLIAVADEGMKRLRSKEEQIMKIGRSNRALEEKVKTLTVDNQLWQQMAQSNEASANVLRRNLHQLLTQYQQQQQQQQQQYHHHIGDATGATVDDVESCCGSNYDDENSHRRTLAKVDVGNEGGDVDAYCTTSGDNNGNNRLCRKCGKEELCVLVLPCRHLCICTVCESSINVCPICKSTKNATLHVNMNTNSS